MPATASSPAFRLQLRDRIGAQGLLREHAPMVHEEGEILTVTARGVHPAVEATLSLRLERAVGGGFAGQVYRARLEAIDGGAIAGLVVGGQYAVKILRPPSSFSLAFRNLMYDLAYQGPFSAQVSEPAIRAGALWQRLIRRGAALALGSERAVVEGFATFFDPALRSWGEVLEWVPGRTWQLEIDQQLFRRWLKDPTVWTTPHEGIPSAEYLAKRAFMARFVRLLHELGAPELARQYEWWSMKSQPNALKRLDAGPGAGEGLCAIDFRAGLALIFCLPMSPVDVTLAMRGLGQGKLVQFDRGDLGVLRAYMDAHAEAFADLEPVWEELQACEHRYRRSLPDLSHHGWRLLGDAGLRRDVRAGLIDAWEVLGRVDAAHAGRLCASTIAFLLFLLAGALPLVGGLGRKLWGSSAWRAHVGRCLTSPAYLGRALEVHQWEALLSWHRRGRVDDARAARLAEHPVRLWLERWTLGWLPMGLHRVLVDPRLLWTRLVQAVAFPFMLYFKPDFRAQWLLDQVEAAKAEGMLDPAEEARLRGSIDDPFIQTYLKCVAVHAATLPITQVVSVIIAGGYYFFWAPPEATWAESAAIAAGILAFFQATPVSPGSITRGCYVLYRMVVDRNVKDYWVAALVSFWHYIGYLGFPIQMVARFPGLARFMAGSWATKAARVVPVFGEKGALIEHLVWDTFFNLPVSLGALFRRRA
ncbi:MAG: hypothetical protein ABIO70_15470 [Pseudomonadota bacterium]